MTPLFCLGQDDYDRLRPLFYPNVNVLLLCFDVTNPNSFDNISTRVGAGVREASLQLLDHCSSLLTLSAIKAWQAQGWTGGSVVRWVYWAGHGPLIPALRKQRCVCFCEFEASLIYIVSPLEIHNEILSRNKERKRERKSVHVLFMQTTHSQHVRQSTHDL